MLSCFKGPFYVVNVSLLKFLNVVPLTRVFETVVYFPDFAQCSNFGKGIYYIETEQTSFQQKNT